MDFSIDSATQERIGALRELGRSQVRPLGLEADRLGRPVPADHPFWGNEKITLTPHASSVTDPRSVAPQIVENYRRLKAGKELMNRVELKRGY